MVTANQEREKQVAVERIVGFAEEFGEEHLILACHGAFPLMLTPDLLYQIWASFVPEAPWTAVARVLLSRLCKQVGYESYEMDIEVRNLLLRELKESHGKGRLDELGAFLLEYVGQRLIEDDPDTQNLREAQEWTALAYTKPDEAARKLAEALSERVKLEEMGEVMRLSSLVETLAEPLVEAGFEPLLLYSRGMGCFVQGDLDDAKIQFKELPIEGQEVKIAEVNLPIVTIKRQNVTIIDNPVVDLDLKLTADKPPEQRTLHVNWDKRKGELCYTIYSPEPEGEWLQQVPENLEQIEDLWRQLDIILYDGITRANISMEQWKGICSSLQGFGQSIFDMFFPPEVAKRVRVWQSGFSVRVSTNEQWIPWELIYDGQDFWGKKFIIARYPRVGDRQTLSDLSRQKRKGFKKIREIVNVIGGGVPRKEAIKASELFNQLLSSVSVELLQEKSVSDLINAVPRADVLHLTCHRHLKPMPLLQITSDKSPTQNLGIDMIKMLPLKPGSLVFANSTHSITPIRTFNNFSNFGWEFYRQGADVFIGTLGIVPVKYAVSFAENFYKQLLSKGDKLTIGQAVAKAKEVAAKENNNLFWLLYCIYGDADLYFEDIST